MTVETTPKPPAAGSATCPFCDEIVPLVIDAGAIKVDVHEDVYPTRVCEGSGLVAQIINGRVYIARERQADR